MIASQSCALLLNELHHLVCTEVNTRIYNRHVTSQYLADYQLDFSTDLELNDSHELDRPLYLNIPQPHLSYMFTCQSLAP